MSLPIDVSICVVPDREPTLDPTDGLGAIMRVVAFNALGCTMEDAPWRPTGGLAPWQLRRVYSVALANFAQPIPVYMLAEACQLSPGHFTKAFKCSTGESPLRWLLRLRIAVAKDFATRTSLSTEEIASACGFVDQSHMNKWFKRLVGMNIKAWQRASTCRRASLTT
jgi:transcriptional regulator GlxA family with amidase domain